MDKIYQNFWCWRVTGKVSVKSEVWFVPGAGGMEQPVRQDGGEDLIVGGELPPGTQVGPGLCVLLQTPPPRLNICTQNIKLSCLGFS